MSAAAVEVVELSPTTTATITITTTTCELHAARRTCLLLLPKHGAVCAPLAAQEGPGLLLEHPAPQVRAPDLAEQYASWLCAHGLHPTEYAWLPPIASHACCPCVPDVLVVALAALGCAGARPSLDHPSAWMPKSNSAALFLLLPLCLPCLVAPMHAPQVPLYLRPSSHSTTCHKLPTTSAMTLGAWQALASSRPHGLPHGQGMTCRPDYHPLTATWGGQRRCGGLWRTCCNAR
jgi:hypothetical protein